jgi:two-component system CheB/CheR fusion protein
MRTPPPPPQFPFTVGIAGSAGALDGYKELLGGLPPQTGMAFVVIYRVDAGAVEALTQILSRHTTMPVQVAADGMPIQGDRVYVVPPTAPMRIEKGVFRGSPAPKAEFDLLNDVLTSLAEAAGAKAIAVILSGYDANVARACKSIKEKGGTVFAQDDSAQVSGLPLSAQASGFVDQVLAPAAIAGALARISQGTPV